METDVTKYLETSYSKRRDLLIKAFTEGKQPKHFLCMASVFNFLQDEEFGRRQSAQDFRIRALDVSLKQEQKYLLHKAEEYEKEADVLKVMYDDLYAKVHFGNK